MNTKHFKNILYNKFAVAGLIVGVLFGLLFLYLTTTGAFNMEVKSAEKNVAGSINFQEAIQTSAAFKSNTCLLENNQNHGGSKLAQLSGSSQKYVSDVFEADFEFNAIAPSWKEEFVEQENRLVEIRVSEDGQEWGNWLEVHAQGPLRDDVPDNGYVYPETPIFTTGKFFQYRVYVWDDIITGQTPRISDFSVNYMDSRLSKTQEIINNVNTKVSRAFTSSATASGQGGPEIISREEWGNTDDPYGGDHSPFWVPGYAPVEQVFLHHTVNDSYTDNPEAVVRSIWNYHANNLGWGDIGYNYLIGPDGEIYEGRFGGDNVVGGHVAGYNTKSVGIAVLGCFHPGSTCDGVNDGPTTAPSEDVLDGLKELLSWKTTNYEIDPTGSHNFCKWDGSDCLNLNKIAAHRDADSTDCNGDYFYDLLPSIRSDVKDLNDTMSWGYSAKQQNYSVVDVNKDSVKNVTLRFKNTGTETWSNSNNRLLLKTANPSGRTSDFQGGDWINSETLAVLNESSVEPGEVGTFSFEIKDPGGGSKRHYEGLRLVSENNTDLSQFFTLRIDKKGELSTASMHRTYNPRTGAHFYTTSHSEAMMAVDRWDFQYEGNMGTLILSTPPEAYNNLYRTYNPRTGAHFYTTSHSEAMNAVNRWDFQYEGRMGRLYRNNASGRDSVHRTYNPSTGAHFYTTSHSEAMNAVDRWGFQYEGRMGYLVK